MAVASGISEDLLDEADDADDVRAAVLKLLREYLCRPEAVVDASVVTTTGVSDSTATTGSAAPDSEPAPEPATVL